MNKMNTGLLFIPVLIILAVVVWLFSGKKLFSEKPPRKLIIYAFSVFVIVKILFIELTGIPISKTHYGQFDIKGAKSALVWNQEEEKKQEKDKKPKKDKKPEEEKKQQDFID